MNVYIEFIVQLLYCIVYCRYKQKWNIWENFILDSNSIFIYIREGIRYTQPIACNINIGYLMVIALKVFWLKNNLVMNFLALHWCSFFKFLFIIWAVICMQLPISIKDSQLLAEDTFLIQPKISTFLILTRYIHSSLDQNFSKLAVCHV